MSVWDSALVGVSGWEDIDEVLKQAEMPPPQPKKKRGRPQKIDLPIKREKVLQQGSGPIVLDTSQLIELMPGRILFRSVRKNVLTPIVVPDDSEEWLPFLNIPDEFL